MKKILLGITLIVLTGIVFFPGRTVTPPAPVGGDISTEEQLFAHVNATSSIVDSVIVISQDTLDQAGGWYVGGVFYPRSEWVQTSLKGTVRKNYAGKGYTWDAGRNAFVPPKAASATLFDEAKAQWVTPCSNGTTTC